MGGIYVCHSVCLGKFQKYYILSNSYVHVGCPNYGWGMGIFKNKDKRYSMIVMLLNCMAYYYKYTILYSLGKFYCQRF